MAFTIIYGPADYRLAIIVESEVKALEHSEVLRLAGHEDVVIMDADTTQPTNPRNTG